MNVIPTPTTGRRAAARTGRPVWAPALALGPLAVAAAQLALPYGVTADSATVAAAAAAHPAAMDVVLWLDLLIAVSLLAGTLVVSAFAIRAAPMLGVVGAVLAAVGFGALTTSAIPPDLLAQAGAQAGVDPTMTTHILDALAAHPSAIAASILFLAGQVLSLIVLGAAFWRSPAAPRWAAAALIVSAPLHVVFPVVVGSSVLSAAAWILTAVAFVAVVVSADPPATSTS